MANYLTDFEIDELSGVDRPAQEPALAAIIKRNASKGGDAGDYLNGENDGVNKSEKDNKEGVIKDMSKDNKTVEDLTNELAELKKTADENAKKTEKLEKVAGLSGVEKTHYDALETDEAKDAFVAKSSEDRAKEIDEVAKAEKDEFVKIDGIDIPKSDTVALHFAKKALKAEALIKTEKIEKAAKDNFGHLPMDDDKKVSLQKAIDDIKDETEKTGLTEALKGLDVKFAESVGKQASSVVLDDLLKGDEDGAKSDSVTDVNKRAEEIQKEDPTIPYDVALERATVEMVS